MIACAQCGFENAAGRKFCGSCGSPLAVVCGTCGAANEPGMRFCGECGSALTEGAAPPTATRAAGRCTAVPRPLVKTIATRLTVPETLRNAQAVRSATKRVWFVSAEIDGPGLVGDGQIGTWAKSGPLAHAPSRPRRRAPWQSG